MIATSEKARLFKELKNACGLFLNEKTSIEDLQWRIRVTESALTSYGDEKDRDFLTSVEGELELILFTVGSQLQRQEGNKIAKKVLKWLEFKK